MPPSNYSKDDKVCTKAEHLLPPILTYLVRKVVLYLIVADLYAVRQVSKVYGFNLTAEVSDRESWKWNVREKIPLYRAQVEKVN